MKIFVFGNIDVECDALPIKIMPKLAGLFPMIEFLHLDPNEEWDIPKDLIIIDTAFGIHEVTVFDSLDAFVAAPQITMHDFDALLNLRLLKKLGQVDQIKIIGLPPMISEADAIEQVSRLVTTISLSKNASNS